MIAYICCAGGMTSSLFCSKIQGSLPDKKIYVDDIHTVFLKFKKNQLAEFDYVMAYGPAEAISISFIKEYEFKGFIDCVLISPQVRFLLDSIQQSLSSYGIPCEVIDMVTFGRMDGEKGLALLNRFKK